MRTRKISKKSNKKKIVAVIFLALGVLIGFNAIKWYIKYRNEQTGEEWLLRQEDYIDDMQTLADDMDNIVTLYINDDISIDDYINHIQQIEQELTILSHAYQQEKTEHPVRLGTETFDTKLGYDSVEHMFETFQNIIAGLMDNCEDKEVLVYEYIGSQQDIIRDLSGYMGSVMATQEADN